jgi:hypothetical protein
MDSEIKEFGRDVATAVDILLETFSVNAISPTIGVSAMLTILAFQLKLNELKTTEEKKDRLAKVFGSILLVPNTEEALGDDTEAT